MRPTRSQHLAQLIAMTHLVTLDWEPPEAGNVEVSFPIMQNPVLVTAVLNKYWLNGWIKHLI